MDFLGSMVVGGHLWPLEDSKSIGQRLPPTFKLIKVTEAVIDDDQTIINSSVPEV